MHTIGAPTPALDQLDTEWATRHRDVMIDLDHLGARTAGEWLIALGYRERGAKTPASAASTPAEKNAILRELIRDAQAGNTSAERTVLRLVTPKTVAFARSITYATGSWDDSLTIALSAAWEGIHTLTLGRGMIEVRGALIWKIQHIVTATRPMPLTAATETATDEAHLATLIEESMPEQNPYAADPFGALVRILTWAIDTGTLTRDEVALIAHVEFSEKSLVELAKDEGKSYEAYKKRVLRARKRLTTAINENMIHLGS